MSQTGSRLSSKLAASVRQAKEQTINEEKTEPKVKRKKASEPALNTPITMMPSKRIWPD